MVAVKPIPPESVSKTWPKANLENPHTRGPGLIITSILLMVLTLAIVGLRTYVRAIILRAPGWDDYFIWMSTVGALALCITVNVSQMVGWDRHLWDQHPSWYQSSELVTWIVQVLFMFIMTLTKLSALVTYLRIATGTRYKRFVWMTILLVILWGVAFTLALIFGCWPVHLYWTSFDGKGCTDESIRLLAATILNIFTDFLVVLMPIPIVIKLQIPRQEKVVLAMLMSLGLFASLASIVRTILMVHELETYDVTWIGYEILIWTTVECDLAIICISIPVLRTLAKRFFPGWSKTFRTTGSSGDRRQTFNTGTSGTNRGTNNEGPISLSSLLSSGHKIPEHAEEREFDHVELQSKGQYWKHQQKSAGTVIGQAV